MAGLRFASSLPCQQPPASPSWCPADAISDKIEDLKKGRSDVLEVRRMCSLPAAVVHGERRQRGPVLAQLLRQRLHTLFASARVGVW